MSNPVRTLIVSIISSLLFFLTFPALGQSLNAGRVSEVFGFGLWILIWIIVMYLVFYRQSS